MIIDAHTHLFPAQIRDQREAYFENEPEFEWLYRPPKSKLVGAHTLIADMDRAGIDKAVVFGFPWRTPALFRLHNDYIMEAVNRYPERLIGLGCFDSFSPQAALEAERCLEGGLAGIGELAFYQAGLGPEALEKLAPVMALCAARKVPVMIHTNEPVGHSYPGKTDNTPAQIYRLIERFSDNRLILAHWGGGIFFFNLLKREAKAVLKNVFFDTAASPYLYDPEIYRIGVQIIGADRILFGSDYPLLKAERYFSEMQRANLSESDIAAICGQNADTLFQVKG